MNNLVNAGEVQNVGRWSELARHLPAGERVTITETVTKTIERENVADTKEHDFQLTHSQLVFRLKCLGVCIASLIAFVSINLIF